MASDLVVVRLTLPLLAKGELAVARSAGASRGDMARVRRAFACSPRERRFARALLERRTNLWLFRTSQRAFGGDFVIVDVSEPRIGSRPVLVVELKDGEPVRSVSADMHQVRFAALAVAAVARRWGAVAREATYRVIRGDAEGILELLRALPGVRAARSLPVRELRRLKVLRPESSTRL